MRIVRTVSYTFDHEKNVTVYYNKCYHVYMYIYTHIYIYQPQKRKSAITCIIINKRASLQSLSIMTIRYLTN